MINKLDPGVISIGGGLSNAFDCFKDNMFKTLSWYDNGYNHASRILDLISSYNKLES